MKLIPSIPQETDDVTSDFGNIVENAKDCGILFILLLVKSTGLIPFIFIENG